ncbi:MAG TPA: arsenate reductase ArsC [Telluria sp.]|nr:arsenate reductase ArsC [Telluria sp.]
MSSKPYKVLFVCSGNSGRSIMAESILTKLGDGRFDAHSAGSHPTWRINPFALDVLWRRGYRTDALASKSWNEFSRFDAPGLDFVIAVCDKAAAEPQPYWPGRPITITWTIPSPDAVQGTDGEVRAVFESVCDQIEAALRAFVALPLEALDANATRALLAEIARA